MLIKSCVLGAVLVSTPLYLLDTQGPTGGSARPAAAAGQESQTKAELRRQQIQLDRVRRELDGARRDLTDMRRQLGELLDSIDSQFVAQRDRNCSPSRSRSLMSHYQWLDKNRHSERADKALAMIVDGAGDNIGRLNSLAWDLMTDKSTAGQFDRIALALAERMEASAQRQRINHTYLDTMALARFLNGQVDHAIALQQQAIANGGSGDDYRRKLRTYEAARQAIVAAAGIKVPPTTAGTVVAVAQEEEEE